MLSPRSSANEQTQASRSDGAADSAAATLRATSDGTADEAADDGTGSVRPVVSYVHGTSSARTAAAVRPAIKDSGNDL